VLCITVMPGEVCMFRKFNCLFLLCFLGSFFAPKISVARELLKEGQLQDHLERYHFDTLRSRWFLLPMQRFYDDPTGLDGVAFLKEMAKGNFSRGMQFISRKVRLDGPRYNLDLKSISQKHPNLLKEMRRFLEKRENAKEGTKKKGTKEVMTLPLFKECLKVWADARTKKGWFQSGGASPMTLVNLAVKSLGKTLPFEAQAMLQEKLKDNAGFKAFLAMCKASPGVFVLAMNIYEHMLSDNPPPNPLEMVKEFRMEFKEYNPLPTKA